MVVFLVLLYLLSNGRVGASQPSNSPRHQSPPPQHHTMKMSPQSSLENAEHTLTCSKREAGNLACRPGLFCKDNRCSCGHIPQHIIRCNNVTGDVDILNCVCVTLKERGNSENVTLAGACILNCGGNFASHKFFYSPLPARASSLHKFCRSMNRTGALCGRCLPGHYPTAYSFNWSCGFCPSVGRNWVLYIMAAYLPLTAFCLLLLFFKVNLVSSQLYAAVNFCQSVSLPVAARVVFAKSYTGVVGVKWVWSLYGVWNLDFFRPFHSGFCLGIGILPTLVLDYMIAAYPLFLILITYFLIVLYDKNYRVIVVLCRPFKALFSRLRKNWSIQTSMIDAFATFFILSNIKFLSVSFDLLVPTKVYELHLDGYNSSLALYYAPDIEYFGKEHIPFAILAILVLFFLVIVPITVLVLYPFAFFQKLLNRFCPRGCRLYILHTFLDSYYGCYKDGTEPGTRDRRWFGAVYFLSRFFFYGVYALLRNVVFFFAAAVIFMLLALLVVSAQPFKPSLSHHNLTHAVFLQLLAMLCVAVVTFDMAALFTPSIYHVVLSVAILLILAPLVYFVLLVSCWAFKKRKGFMLLLVKASGQRKGYHALNSPDVHSDRIVNPSLYPKGNLSSFPSPEF